MFHLRNYPVLSLFILILFIISCRSSEIGESKDVNPDTIYQGYEIVYDEQKKDNQVEVSAQFRFAGDEGTTLVLSKPSSIVFDGQKIKVDSSEFSGAFYNIDVPVKEFVSKHHFVFTDINKKRFENEFYFDVFRLQAPPAASKTVPLMIQFEASPLSNEDYIELTSINTDSSFFIKHLASEQGNIIIIPVNELQRQKGNSLSLVASIWRNVPLQQSTKEGGHIILYHSVKPVTISLCD
jgi:hypothetical protein